MAATFVVTALVSVGALVAQMVSYKKSTEY